MDVTSSSMFLRLETGGNNCLIMLCSDVGNLANSKLRRSGTCAGDVSPAPTEFTQYQIALDLAFAYVD